MPLHAGIPRTRERPSRTSSSVLLGISPTSAARGTYVTDYTMINVSKKRAVSVSVTKYELTSYSW